MARMYKDYETLIAESVTSDIREAAGTSGLIDIEIPISDDLTIYVEGTYVLYGHHEDQACDLMNVWVCTAANVSVKVTALDGEGEDIDLGIDTDVINNIVESNLEEQ